MYKVKPKNIKVQFDVVDRDCIPFAIIVGSTEIADQKVRIKEQHSVEVSAQLVESGEKDGNGTEVARGEMVGWLLAKLGREKK